MVLARGRTAAIAYDDEDEEEQSPFRTTKPTKGDAGQERIPLCFSSSSGLAWTELLRGVGTHTQWSSLWLEQYITIIGHIQSNIPEGWHSIQQTFLKNYHVCW